MAGATARSPVAIKPTAGAGRVESILVAAVQVSDAAERRAFLDRACGGDASLRGRGEELVANHFAAGSFLESPAPPVPGLEEVLAEYLLAQEAREAPTREEFISRHP